MSKFRIKFFTWALKIEAVYGLDLWGSVEKKSLTLLLMVTKTFCYRQYVKCILFSYSILNEKHAMSIALDWAIISWFDPYILRSRCIGKAIAFKRWHHCCYYILESRGSLQIRNNFCQVLFGVDWPTHQPCQVILLSD